jgi:glycosyltransferase involved in cell wall biosynthesis
VATDVGDVREIVGAAGYVVQPRDPAALAAGWRRIAAMSAGQRKVLGTAARARAETFGLGEVVAQYEALYQDVMSSGSTTAPGAH